MTFSVYNIAEEKIYNRQYSGVRVFILLNASQTTNFWTWFLVHKENQIYKIELVQELAILQSECVTNTGD